MKAVCVTPERELEVRDAPAPGAPPEGHVLIKMEACAINHGDHTFLKMRSLMNMPATLHDIWGASGAGRVVAVGPGAPQNYMGKKVAIYRSISMIHSRQTVGLWSEQAQVHYLSCLILPDHVDCRDYSGSLVNIITAYAFLRQIVDEGHRGIWRWPSAFRPGRQIESRRQGRTRQGLGLRPIVQAPLGLRASGRWQGQGCPHVAPLPQACARWLNCPLSR
jgi:NADPH:quinone reductase-like Zn-dependent oxidoreductase